MASKASATVMLPTLTQTGASVALKAAEFYATELGVPMSIAVVDAHTHLLAFMRMDGAKHSSIDTALAMATTCASNRLPTSALSCTSNSTCTSTPTSPTTSTSPTITTNPGSSHHLCPPPGGLPILSPTGALLGAIGCSTGTSLQDDAAAAAAGRDAVLVLIRAEGEDEARRLEEEREEVLRLWREKESEVEELRGLLVHDGRDEKRRKVSNVGLAPDTPPEEGEMGVFRVEVR